MLSISPFPNPSLWNYLIDFNQILCIIFLSSVFFLKPKHDGFVQEMIQCKRKIYRKLGGSLSYSLKPNCQYYKSLCVGFLIYKYRIFKLDQYSSMMRPHEGCKVRHSNIFFFNTESTKLQYDIYWICWPKAICEEQTCIFDTEPTRIVSRGVNLRLSVEVKEFVARTWYLSKYMGKKWDENLC